MIWGSVPWKLLLHPGSARRGLQRKRFVSRKKSAGIARTRRAIGSSLKPVHTTISMAVHKKKKKKNCIPFRFKGLPQVHLNLSGWPGSKFGSHTNISREYS